MGMFYTITKFKKLKTMRKVENCKCPLAKSGELFLQSEEFVKIDSERSYRVSVWSLDWVAEMIETMFPNLPKNIGDIHDAYVMSFDQLEDIHAVLLAAKAIFDSASSDEAAMKKKGLVYRILGITKIPDTYRENEIEYLSLDSFYKLEDVVSTMFNKSRKDKDCVFAFEFA